MIPSVELSWRWMDSVDRDKERKIRLAPMRSGSLWVGSRYFSTTSSCSLFDVSTSILKPLQLAFPSLSPNPRICSQAFLAGHLVGILSTAL